MVGIKESGGEGGIHIRRLNFAKNIGKFLPLLPTLPVTCDLHAHFTSILGKSNSSLFGSNGSHFGFATTAKNRAPRKKAE